MTKLVVSIPVRTRVESQRLCQRAWQLGAEIVELRVDYLQDPPDGIAEDIRTNADRSWLVTCRSAAQGGQSQATPLQRAQLVTDLVRGTSAAIDFERVDYEAHREVRTILEQAGVGANTHRLILSDHYFADDATSQAVASIRQRPQLPPGVTWKLAYLADDGASTLHALDCVREYKQNVAPIAMGDFGAYTRALTRKFGAWGTYASLPDVGPLAPGQVSIAQLHDEWGWTRIHESTRVFGLIGDPVGHSLSPALFQRWFTREGLNAVYLPFRVAKGPDLFRFLDGICRRPWLDVGGCSVTIPHKEAVLQWLGDRAHRTVRWVGAVNTLVFGRGQVAGYNTDCHAAIDSLTQALRITRKELRGLRVDLLGAGGAARAVLTPLIDFGAIVTVYGRSPQTLSAIAAEFACPTREWSQRGSRTGEVLIHATGIGMAPNVDDSPMPAESLCGCRFVFDMIYNPVQTRLLRDASAAGIAVQNGLSMFVRQAKAQFALWMGREVNDAEAEVFLLRRLGVRGQPI